MEMPPLGYFTSQVGGMSVRGKIRRIEREIAQGDIRYANLSSRTRAEIIDYLIDDDRNQAYLNALPTPYVQ